MPDVETPPRKMFFSRQRDQAEREPMLPGQRPGFQRILYLLLGFLSLGLAYMGWLLPGLPCTPFVILASWCFGQSSERLQRWLVNNKLFGPILKDFHHERGIQRKYKIRSTILVTMVVTASVVFLIAAGRPWYVWALLPLAALAGLGVIWFGPRTLPDRSPSNG